MGDEPEKYSNMGPTGFSISEYHDIKPIYEKLNRLVSLPLQQIAPAQMDKYWIILIPGAPKAKR